MDLLGITAGDEYILYITDSKGCTDTLSGSEPCKLDVDLIRFEGEVAAEGNLLIWATAAELNSDYYILQRSVDGINFINLANIDSKGNSTATQLYNYLDKTAAPCTAHFYRLVEVDNYGYTEIISDVIRIFNAGQTCTDVTVAPNPATDKLTVVVGSSVNEESTITVYDVTGRIAFQQMATLVQGINSIPLDINQLPAGAYQLIIVSNNSNKAVKFIKK